MSIEQRTLVTVDQAMDVTKSQKCMRCQKLLPLAAYSAQNKKTGELCKTCKRCQERATNARKWREGLNGALPQLYSRARGTIDKVLKFNNRRLCYYCFSDLHVDEFTLDDPYECNRCEGKWYTPKEEKREKKKVSKLEQYIAAQEKVNAETKEQLNALMNVMSRSVRLPTAPIQDPPCPACGSANTKSKGSFDKCMDCGARITDYYKPEFHGGDSR